MSLHVLDFHFRGWLNGLDTRPQYPSPQVRDIGGIANGQLLTWTGQSQDLWHRRGGHLGEQCKRRRKRYWL